MGIVKGAFSTTLALDNSQADRYYLDSRMTLNNKSIKIRKKRGKQFMELKHVIPNMEKTFGNLEFAGENKVEQRRINGRMTVVSRSFNLYSDVQRADDIIFLLPASAVPRLCPSPEPAVPEDFSFQSAGFVPESKTDAGIHCADIVPQND